MTLLTRPTRYDIEDSNIALLGSDLEKRVREAAGDGEAAWESAGMTQGLEIWRIEQFHVVHWPKERYGSFYDGDSYIVLYTYKKSEEARSFSYNLHFWLGQNTSQDEAGTAAYKTVELDDYLGGKPVQFREIQGYESPQLLSYFPRFVSLKGGVATGFQTVSAEPPHHVKKLYRVTLSRKDNGKSNLVVREVSSHQNSLVAGDVYVLDKGDTILQLNSRKSAGQERYRAAEFAQSIVQERQGKPNIEVFDENRERAFLAEFGAGATALREEEDISATRDSITTSLLLYKISDESGTVIFQQVESPTRHSLDTKDAFLADFSYRSGKPAIFLWIGNGASRKERHLSLQLAQQYLYDKKAKTQSRSVVVAIPIIQVQEGEEPLDLLEAFE